MTNKGKKLTKEMEKNQELEWVEAQNIVISEDLVVAAKRQLQFLAEVDRNRHLYDGRALDRAIYRYKYCWLPLLAKHEKSQLSECPLVVPLDCEWVWHCHRLNPVRYKADCEALFGTILDVRDVESSVSTSCKDQTIKIWNQMYPNEPYELNMSSQFSKDFADNVLVTQQSTNYDLVAAVKRQSTFFYQVSRPHMADDRFLEEALARYKGFLHLIKRNQERSIRQFSVPTYDIDLIWHSHQLNPTSYCKDIVALIGNVLQHDDTDSDRSKGKKLDTGFSGTSKQWEDAYGTSYWKAGAMHRGNTPSPLTFSLSNQDTMTKKIVSSNENENVILLPKKMLVEVMLEIVEVRDSPADDKGSLFVTIDKKMLDSIFKTRRRLNISSETGRKQVTVFQCEPNGVLVFELMSHGPCTSPGATFAKSLGTTSISLQNLMNPVSQLSLEKWFDIVPISRGAYTKPIRMRIALSFTPPVTAPYLLNMAPGCPFSTSCFFPLSGKYQQAKSWTCFVDETGNEIINIHMRNSMELETRNHSFPKQEVIGITKNGETHVLAESVGTGWSLMDSKWKLQLDKKYSKDDNIIELIGSRKVVIIPGRKMEYGTDKNEKHSGEHDFMTAVEISADYPHGKAAAQLNLKSGILKINEEWLVLPMITLAFLLSDDSRKNSNNEDGYSDGRFPLIHSLFAACSECAGAACGVGCRAVRVNVEEAIKGTKVAETTGNSYSGGSGYEVEALLESNAFQAYPFEVGSGQKKDGCDDMMNTNCGNCGACNGGSSDGAVDTFEGGNVQKDGCDDMVNANCGNGGCGGGGCNGGCGGGGCGGGGCLGNSGFKSSNGTN